MRSILRKGCGARAATPCSAAVNTVFIALSVLVTLYPLLYVLSASISDPNKVNSGAMWLWPVDVTFLGYRKVFSNPDIWAATAT